jgi:hypothetical protein
MKPSEANTVDAGPKAFQDNISARHIVLQSPAGTPPGED